MLFPYTIFSSNQHVLNYRNLKWYQFVPKKNIIFQLSFEKISVFTFPRFYSIFFVDFSQIFDPFHTYLKHGTVMGSNICEVSDLFHIVFEFSLTLLCLQTRQSLFWTQSNHSPQLIKKKFVSLSIAPAAAAGSEPATRVCTPAADLSIQT